MWINDGVWLTTRNCFRLSLEIDGCIIFIILMESFSPNSWLTLQQVHSLFSHLEEEREGKRGRGGEEREEGKERKGGGGRRREEERGEYLIHVYFQCRN